MSAALAVIAKAPAPGRSKTRLSPPLTLGEAAALAQAALIDTLAAVQSSCATRRIVVLDGEPGPWMPKGFELLRQRGDGLDERLGNAFADIGEPALIVGMDTPQLDPAALDFALGRLSDTPAVLGAAHDGGYWAIGLRTPDPELLRGVPMSCGSTLAAQRQRFRDSGLRFCELAPLTDVDTYADAIAVAALAPRSRFGMLLAELLAPAPS